MIGFRRRIEGMDAYAAAMCDVLPPAEWTLYEKALETVDDDPIWIALLKIEQERHHARS